MSLKRAPTTSKASQKKASIGTKEVQVAISKALQGDPSLLDKIPLDIVRLITEQLDIKDIANLCRVSTHFEKNICNNESWWKKIRQDLTNNEKSIADLQKLFQNNIKAKNVSSDINISRSPLEFYRLFQDIGFSYKKEVAAKYGLDLFLLPLIVPKDQIDAVIYFKFFHDIDPKKHPFAPENTEDYVEIIEEDLIPELAWGNHRDMLQQLIEMGYSTKHALPKAVRTDDPELIKLIIDNAGPFDDPSYFLVDGLIEAVREDKRDIIDLLLDEGADINAIEQERYSPLNIAYRVGDVDLVKFLIERGASTTDEDDFYAVLDRQSVPLLRYLLEDLEVPVPDYVLSTALQRRDIDVIKYLLSRPDIFVKTDDYTINLSVNDVNLVKMVVDAHSKYDPNGPNVDRILRDVVQTYYENPADAVDLFEYLVKKGANVSYLPPVEKLPPYFRDVYQKYAQKRVKPVSKTPMKTPVKSVPRTPTKEGPQPGYCHAKTQKGDWCSRKAQEGSKYCWQHTKQH